MDNTRHGLRTRCLEKCLLILDGAVVEGMLADISLSGALIRTGVSIAGAVPGRECSLHLCSSPDVCPTAYSCRITRLSPGEIGITFISREGLIRD